MSLIRRTGSLFVLAALLGCGGDTILRPPSGLKYSVAQWTCGPADGPAVAIFLTRDPTEGPNAAPPYVRIYIDLTKGSLDGRSHPVTGGSADASAWFQYGISSSELATDGFLTASESVDQTEIDGSVYLVFPQAGQVVGSFHAHLFPNNALCA